MTNPSDADDERDPSGTVLRPSGAATNPDGNSGGTELRPRPPPASYTPPAPPIEETASVWIEPDAVPAAGPVATGQLLGHRYLLERELGEGGMGMVFFASDQDVKGETFAIKVLKPEIREHLDALEMLRE